MLSPGLTPEYTIFADVARVHARMGGNIGNRQIFCWQQAADCSMPVENAARSANIAVYSGVSMPAPRFCESDLAVLLHGSVLLGFALHEQLNAVPAGKSSETANRH